MRAISSQTRYDGVVRDALGVGLAEAHTQIGRETSTPSTLRILRSADGRRAPGRADPYEPALRRADRRRYLDGKRDPRLPLPDGDLGAGRPARVRLALGFSSRPGAKAWEFYALALPRCSCRRSRIGLIERWRNSRSSDSRGSRDPEHRPPPRAGREPRCGRGARLDPNRELSRLRLELFAAGGRALARGG